MMGGKGDEVRKGADTARDRKRVGEQVGMKEDCEDGRRRASVVNGVEGEDDGEEGKDGWRRARSASTRTIVGPTLPSQMSTNTQRPARARNETGLSVRTSTRFMFGMTALTSRMTFALAAGSNFSILTLNCVFSFGFS